ncbi:pectinesterase family protein, partial [Shigella flexneri]|nr:pectinesterase family protein [Shigella flexneri]
IKKGVYKEYVEIGKKKWNIMMIGDGMDATVISGNRSFVDGWTTYRSATFGNNFLSFYVLPYSQSLCVGKWFDNNLHSFTASTGVMI